MYLHNLPWVHHLCGQHCHGPREGARGGAVAPTRRLEEPPTFPQIRKFLLEVHPGLQLRRRTSHPPSADQGEVHLGPEAEEAFRRLKGQFTSAPILIHLDPDRQFIVEVDGLQHQGGGSPVPALGWGHQGAPVQGTRTGCPQPSRTMISGIRSCWPLSWPSRSGGSGSRELGCRSWSGRTIKTSSTSTLQRD